jgi:hypothetical protein
MEPKVDFVRVAIRKDVGDLLMLRSSVAPLFRKIAKLTSSRVIFDFSGVEFMSRSFADEYLAEKARCNKQIEERHVPDEAKLMMELVSRQVRKASTRNRLVERAIQPPRAVAL